MRLKNRWNAAAHSSIGPVAAVVVLCLAIPTWLYRLWSLPLDVPLNYRSDALPVGMVIKEIITGGWFFHEPQLGAPFGQNHIDWPQPNVSTQVLMWLVGQFTNQYGVVLNLLYILAFPLIGLAAWWVMRSLGVARWIAVVFAVIFSILPYHFTRAQSHLYLGMYFPIPIAVWLCVKVLRGDALLRWTTRRQRYRFFGVLNWYNTRTILFAVLIAAQDPYYGYMAAVLLSACLLLRAMSERPTVKRIVALGRDAIPVAVMIVTVVLCSLPSLLYYRENGPNPLNALRRPWDTDAFALKIAHLLLPVSDHRIGRLGEYTDHYLRAFPLPSEARTAALGIVGVIGLIVLTGIGLLRANGKLSEYRSEAQLSIIAFVGVVTAAVGGISTFVSLSVTPVFRSLSRMSIIIGFCALAVLGLVVSRLWSSLARPWTRVLVSLGLVGTLVIAFFDQTNTPTLTNGMVFGHQMQSMPAHATMMDYQRSLISAFRNDERFVRDIESQLPKQAMVYQLPYTEFFATSKHYKLREFEMLQPYLHSSTLRWSFGAQEGRLEANWNKRLSDENDASAFLFDIVAAGFDGVTVDVGGYDSGVGEQVIARLAAVAGVSPHFDGMNNRAFIDVRHHGEGLRATHSSELAKRKSELLFPASVEAAVGLRDFERDEQGEFQWSERPTVDLPVRSVASDTLPMTVRFEVAPRVESPATFTVSWPDGSQDTKVSGVSDQELLRFEKTFEVKPGRSHVRVSSDAPCVPEDESQLCFRLHQV